MDVHHIDHVNIRIPKSGVDEAVTFYRDGLGLEPERLEAYQSGDRTLFSFRLNDVHVLHVRPVDDFSPPTTENFDHWALVVNDSIDDVKAQLADADIPIDRESTPLGATGRAPAVYVTDPFGYTIEIKERTE